MVAGSPANIPPPSQGDARAARQRETRLNSSTRVQICIWQMQSRFRVNPLRACLAGTSSQVRRPLSSLRSSCAQPTSALCHEVPAYRSRARPDGDRDANRIDVFEKARRPTSLRRRERSGLPGLLNWLRHLPLCDASRSTTSAFAPSIGSCGILTPDVCCLRYVWCETGPAF